MKEQATKEQTLSSINPYLLEHGHRRPRDLTRWIVPAGMAIVGILLIIASTLVKQ